MLASLSQRGFLLVEEPEDADVIVVNTCAFLTEATQESVQRILDLSDHKSDRCEKIVATGCLSERYREELLSEIPELDGLLGSSQFDRIPELLEQLYSQPGPQVFLNEKAHYRQYESQARIQSTPRHFAYVKIAEGCSNMCSFCNIPSLRGLFSSRSIPSITTEIQQLVDAGVQEINIISQDTASYGKDLTDGTNLSKLLRGISDLKGDFWIRLFYVYPNTFTEEVAEIMASDPRFCRYLDMPFQHINDAVLDKMNRKITRKSIESKMAVIRKHLPDLAWRTTFIVGFPTETDEAFEELFEFVKEGHFCHVGVFHYSHEDNIRSSKWGDPVPNALKRERRKRLMELQQHLSYRQNKQQIGKILQVLVDGPSKDSELMWQGRSQYQGPDVDGVVFMDAKNAIKGMFQQIEITEAQPYDLIGRVMS